jgi:pyruvate dehydrogenase E1 component alpha subunit
VTRTESAALRQEAQDDQLEMLRLMLRIRRFEEKLAYLFKRGRLPGFVHLYLGEEAVATGICSALRADDRITSTHRGHGHLIAKGARVDRMMAELLGKVDGYCRGKGGSMHIVDFNLGIIGTNGIVGGGIPIGTGSAWGDKQLGRDNVTVTFFGDGASNQGVFFESMNLAAIWKLPVIFCVENNGYTEWTATEKLTAGRIADRATPFGIPSVQVDGNDVLAVRAAAEEAVARGRAGEGPTVIECMTYRWHGHNEGEETFAGNYRPQDEQDAWRAREPISAYVKTLIATGVLTQEDADRSTPRRSRASTTPGPSPSRARSPTPRKPSRTSSPPSPRAGSVRSSREHADRQPDRQPTDGHARRR